MRFIASRSRKLFCIGSLIAAMVWGCLAFTPVAYGQQSAPDARMIRAVEEQLGAWESTQQPIVLSRDQLLALLAILKRGEDPTSLSVLRVLARAKEPLPVEAIPALIEATNDPRFYIRRDAAIALARVGARAVEPLKKLLNSDSPRQRAAAVAALGQLGSFEVPQLRPLVGDEDARVRAEVAHVLSRLGAPALPLLQRLLADPETAVRVEAIGALASWHEEPERVVASLIPLLAERDTAAAAYEALAQHGVEATAAIPAILRAWPSFTIDIHHCVGARMLIRLRDSAHHRPPRLKP